MKKSSRAVNNIINLLTALLIGTMMCFCMCACGDSGNTEETVEITTPSEEGDAAADDAIEIGDSDQDEGSSDDSDDTDADESSSQYAKIYKDYNVQMKEATAKYVGELKDKASSLSKNKLYDETQAKIEDLKKVYDEGKGKMVDAMLASTEDDAKEYKKYFKKMTEAYTEYSREITSTYTDAF